MINWEPTSRAARVRGSGGPAVGQSAVMGETGEPGGASRSAGLRGRAAGAGASSRGQSSSTQGHPGLLCTKPTLSVWHGEAVEVIARHLCAAASLPSLLRRFVCAAAPQEHAQIRHLILLVFAAFTQGQHLPFLRIIPDMCWAVSLEMMILCHWNMRLYVFVPIMVVMLDCCP